jgi:hypothetical protein
VTNSTFKAHFSSQARPLNPAFAISLQNPRLLMNVTPHFTTTFAVIGIALIASNSAFAQNPSDMRPALVGSGPKSLVNLINTKHLMERGVRHGALFFMAQVDPNGFPSYSKVWGMTKETAPLRDELRERLAEARFIPAIYNNRKVYSWFYGTLAFSATDGKPHLRIFANQELPELQKETDFIAPQPIWLPGKIYDYAKLKDPFGSWMNEDKPGAADLILSVDAAGHIKDVRVERVEPADKKAYADEALKRVQQWLCMPAYRNGKPVESTTHVKFYFVPAFYRLQ